MFKINELRGALIVSCQPEADEAYYDRHFVCGMAQAAAAAGAQGLRLNGPESIKAVKALLDLPVIGIWKAQDAPGDVYITPTLSKAEALVAAGAEIVALDATLRPRPEALDALIQQLKSRYPQLCLMADVSTLEEGQNAEKLGFDCVGTTLSGYTDNSPQQDAPDFQLLQDLCQQLQIPVIMEGRIASPAQARKALDLGAHAVVVGSAITRPEVIARQYVAQLKAPPGA